MSVVISQASIEEARSLWSEGRVSDAWSIIGNEGDNYALSASVVTGPRVGGGQWGQTRLILGFD